MQSGQEELNQSFSHARIELFGIDDQFVFRHRLVGLTIAPLWQAPEPHRHLVERDTSRVALCRQVPSLRFPIDEERVHVTGRADSNVVQRGTSQ